MTKPLSLPKPAFKPLQLDPLDALTDLFALDAPSASASATVAITPVAAVHDGQPRQLPMKDIDEDPAQPRSEFDPQALQQLAETIAQRGVRQPISVRPHPEQAGRWMLNFGARRLRASTLAGKTDIPAFVDTTADSYDQVIENEQREGLRPLELALFVQRRLALGDSQAEIARQMGKSRVYVTHATALIEAPDWVMAAYREGRCTGLSDLYELRKLHATHPQYVEAWGSDRNAITRDRVRALGVELHPANGSIRAAVSQTTAAMEATPEALDSSRGADFEVGHESPQETRTRPELEPVSESQFQPERSHTTSARILQARLDDAIVSVVLDRAPDAPGQMFVRISGSTAVQSVEASRLTLIGFVAP